MKLKHKFIDVFGYEVNQDTNLLISYDKCIICDFIFEDYIHHATIVAKKRKTVEEFYYHINKLYPCLNEEEYIIKKLLE